MLGTSFCQIVVVVVVLVRRTQTGSLFQTLQKRYVAFVPRDPPEAGSSHYVLDASVFGTP